MSLSIYRRRRDFAKTPEPGAVRATKKAASQPSRAPRTPRSAPIFVVQKHDATRLHYDFRLEHAGVLKSWAVPKGPSLDPAQRRLAVEVEDHPLEYAGFEGVIPAKQYGAGPVIIWDRGTWAMQAPGSSVDAALSKGTLKFVLHGTRLRGGFTLVRMPDQDARQPNWLLIKERDQHALAGDAAHADREPASVASGLTIDQMRANRGARTWTGKADSNPRPARKPTAASPNTRRSPAKKAPRTAAPPATAEFDPATLDGARHARPPADPRPQLALVAAAVPAGPDWAHEIKFDGYRMLARLAAGRARMLSRTGKDWTHRFPHTAAAVEQLPVADAILDGEIVALRPDGISDFAQLQAALSEGRTGHLTFMLFDVLQTAGIDLTPCALRDRRRALQHLLGATPPPGLRLSEQLGANQDLARVACELGLEGIVSKRLASRYVPARNGDWVKVRCTNRQEFVVGGLTTPQGTRAGFGALAVGYFDPRGRLIYAGRVGSGFSGEQLLAIERAAARHPAPASPFHNLRTGPEARGVRWLQPRTVIEVEFLGWTGDNRLRHAVFRGVREDKPARDVVLERPQPAERAEPDPREPSPSSAPRPKPAPRAAPHEPDLGIATRTARRSPAPPRAKPGAPDPVYASVAITHAHRVVYPVAGVTKGDVAAYYAAVAPLLLPHAEGRPLSLVRCPRGAGAPCFFNKHLDITGQPGLRSVTISESDGPAEYAVLTSAAGLIHLAQMNALELHAWGAKADRLEQPDRLVFDLDPGEGVTWQVLCAAAHQLRTLLQTLGLDAFVKTTGGKGLHVVVPIRRELRWDACKGFCRSVGAVLAAREPGKFLLKMSKAERRGKIFIDYLRNDRGATSVLAYSTRSRPNATVAMPLEWHDLVATDPAAFTVRTAADHIRSRARDPWELFPSTRQRLSAALIAAIDDALAAHAVKAKR